MTDGTSLTETLADSRLHKQINFYYCFACEFYSFFDLSSHIRAPYEDDCIRRIRDKELDEKEFQSSEVRLLYFHLDSFVFHQLFSIQLGFMCLVNLLVSHILWTMKWLYMHSRVMAQSSFCKFMKGRFVLKYWGLSTDSSESGLGARTHFVYHPVFLLFFFFSKFVCSFCLLLVLVPVSVFFFLPNSISLLISFVS